MKNKVMEAFIEHGGACGEALAWMAKNPGHEPVWYWDNCPYPWWLAWMAREFYDSGCLVGRCAFGTRAGFYDWYHYVDSEERAALELRICNEIRRQVAWVDVYDAVCKFLEKEGHL